MKRNSDNSGRDVMSGTTARRTTRTGRLAAGLLAAGALTLAACGGGDSDGGTATAGDGSNGAGVPAEAGSGSGGDLEALATDPGALPTTPIDLADVRVYEPGVTVVRAVPIDPVINTCDALSGAELTEIVVRLSEEAAFGDGPTFADGELLGPRCTYVSDTHVVSVLVGSSDDVSLDLIELFTPIGSGEVTATPWATDGAVQVLSEDSFGLNTPFAALRNEGEYGILANNSGGTGIDYGSEGELFARMAAAVAANIGSAGEPVPVDPTLNIQTLRPCSLYSEDEAIAFAQGAMEPIEGKLRTEHNGTECEYGSFNEGINFRIGGKHASEAAEEARAYDPSPNSDAVFSNSLGSAYVVTDDVVLQVRVDERSGGNPVYNNTRPAALQLAENLAMRLGL